MKFKPRILRPGWFRQCLTNAVKLSLRNPIAWLCIYIIPLTLSGLTREMPLQILLAGFVIIGGTVLAFNSDTQSSEPLHKVVRRISSVIYAFLAIAIVAWMTLWHLGESTNDILIQSQDAIFLGRFSIAFVCLLFGVAMVNVALFAFDIFIKSFIVSEKEKENFFIPPDFPVIGIFSIHLLIEQGTNLVLVGICDQDAVALNMSTILVIIILYLGCVIFPPFIGIFIPFVYCVYREIFWNIRVSVKTKRRLPQ